MQGTTPSGEVPVQFAARSSLVIIEGPARATVVVPALLAVLLLLVVVPHLVPSARAGRVAEDPVGSGVEVRIGVVRIITAASRVVAVPAGHEGQRDNGQRNGHDEYCVLHVGLLYCPLG